MTDVEVALRCAAVAVLVSFLVTKRRQRLHAQRERYEPAKWVGSSIDAAQLQTALECVRRDPLAARPRAKSDWFHRHLIALARTALHQLPYFRDREADAHYRTISTVG